MSISELTPAPPMHVSPAQLVYVIHALNHPLRLQVVARLRHGRQYVSALARELGISRPLLYMHLERLESAGLIAGSLELSAEGEAVKWYSLVPFELLITPELIADAVGIYRTGPSGPGGSNSSHPMRPLSSATGTAEPRSQHHGPAQATGSTP